MSNEITYNDYLAHYGIKGMKWGVRKSRTPGVSRRTDREARKDAKEYARAKMFYGEGAGTRRKLIKNTVEAKAKKDPTYKKAFDNHLASQDMSAHAQKARRERKRKDTSANARKTVRGVKNLALGTGASATTAAAVMYYAYQNPVIREKAAKAGNVAIKNIQSYKNKSAVKDWARKNGF